MTKMNTSTGDESGGSNASILNELWPLAYIILGLTLLVFTQNEGLSYMLELWELDEYSYGYIIPVISVYLIVKKFPEFESLRPVGRLWGVALLITGSIVFIIGELSSLFSIIHYSFIICIISICMSLIGRNGTFKIIVPLLYLVFMVPLPHFLHVMLSAKLQLISSDLGVGLLRLFSISVFLEGNVIDLGSYKLQVVEACSGLRYLFPLMSFSFLVAYIFKAPMWQRGVLFLSAVPITILMNSFRIAVIGITVNKWGIAAAEGFLHDFEGWVIFMACVGILLLEVMVFHKLIGKQTGSFIDRLDVHLPEKIFDRNYFCSLSPINILSMGSILILVFMLILSDRVSNRNETVPERTSFSVFPLMSGQWRGIEGKLENGVIDTLKFSDYIVADFKRKSDSIDTNLYIAYYDTQRKGVSAHSPRTCIPGGGWKITELSNHTVDAVQFNSGDRLKVNRVVIQKEEYRTLVYYWFQQRGRNVTNEYLTKWFIFWDALTRNRSDGALIRVSSFVPAGTSIEDADERMSALLGEFSPLFSEYIPN